MCLENISAGLYANRCFLKFIYLFFCCPDNSIADRFEVSAFLLSGVLCESGVAEKFERMVNDVHGSCEPEVRRSRWGWESTRDRLQASFLFGEVTDRLTDEVRFR